MSCIYALSSSLEPDEFRYVGQAARDNGNTRLAGHWREARRGDNTWKCNWMRKVQAEGGQVISTVLETGLTRTESNKWEIFYIRTYKDLGHRLTNRTAGGDGKLGCTNSVAHRAATTLRHKGVPYSAERKARSDVRNAARREARALLIHDEREARRITKEEKAAQRLVVKAEFKATRRTRWEANLLIRQASPTYSAEQAAYKAARAEVWAQKRTTPEWVEYVETQRIRATAQEAAMTTQEKEARVVAATERQKQQIVAPVTREEQQRRIEAATDGYWRWRRSLSDSYVFPGRPRTPVASPGGPGQI